MKNLKKRIVGFAFLGFAVFLVTPESWGQSASCGTTGFRDYYEDCSISTRMSIGLVNVLIETSGSVNNCQSSINNVCDSHACQSEAMNFVIKTLKEFER